MFLSVSITSLPLHPLPFPLSLTPRHLYLPENTDISFLALLLNGQSPSVA